jgi:hypothetical protein
MENNENTATMKYTAYASQDSNHAEIAIPFNDEPHIGEWINYQGTWLQVNSVRDAFGYTQTPK